MWEDLKGSKSSCEIEYKNGRVQPLIRLGEKQEKTQEQLWEWLFVSGLNLARPASQKPFACGYCKT
jgi:hypothetical protein